MTTQITTHNADALARLRERSKDKPNLEALLGVYVTPVQTLEDVLWALYTERGIETAEGTQLDVLGKIVGQARGGLSDEDYRRYLRARIAANRSSGLLEDLIHVIDLIVADEDAVFYLEQQFPASGEFEVQEIAVTDAIAEILADFIYDTEACGTRWLLRTSADLPEEMFAFAPAAQSLELEKDSTQYAEISHANQVGLGLSGDFTLEGWIHIESGTSDDEFCLCSKWQGGGQFGYYLYYENVGGAHEVVAVISTDGLAIRQARSGHIDLDVGWHHIAVTWDRSADDVWFYIDGVQFGTVKSFGTTAVIHASTADFRVGSIQTTPFHWMDGFVDEVRVWDAVRTPTQIADNYDQEIASPTPVRLQGYWKFNGGYNDSTANGNDLTPVNDPIFNEDVPFGSLGTSPGKGWGQPPVVWTSTALCTVDGNDIVKSFGGAAWTGGGISDRSVAASNDCYCEFWADEVDKDRACGLDNADVDYNYTDIDFCIRLFDNGLARLYEAGVVKFATFAYASGDVFQIRVVSGVVAYYQNGTLLYTSATSPTYPLHVDAAIYDVGGSIRGALLEEGDTGKLATEKEGS